MRQRQKVVWSHQKTKKPFRYQRSAIDELISASLTEPEKFAEDLALAKEYSLMLLETFNRLRRDAIERMGHEAQSLPAALTLPGPGG